MSEQDKAIGEVTIPAHIFVRCPKRDWKLCQARRCDTCEHFHGLAQKMSREGKPMPFEQEFEVRCSYPIERELYHVQIEADR